MNTSAWLRSAAAVIALMVIQLSQVDEFVKYNADLAEQLPAEHVRAKLVVAPLLTTWRGTIWIIPETAIVRPVSP
jgi:hypothetical protein